jgi:hypothetical protein
MGHMGCMGHTVYMVQPSGIFVFKTWTHFLIYIVTLLLKGKD